MLIPEKAETCYF